MTLPPLPEPHLLVFDAALQSRIDGWTHSQVEAYARVAVEAEREACAKVCDAEHGACWHANAMAAARAAERCADAIRARGAKEQGNSNG